MQWLGLRLRFDLAPILNAWKSPRLCRGSPERGVRCRPEAHRARQSLGLELHPLHAADCVFGGVLLAASPSKYNSANPGNRTANRSGDNMKYTTAVLLALLLAACGGESTSMTASDESSGTEEFSVSDSGVKTKKVEGFGGVIAESYGDSQEWWAEEERPNEDAPMSSSSSSTMSGLPRWRVSAA